MRLFTIALLLALAAGCGGGDSGPINCAAYIDRSYECGVLPAETRDQLRDTNIRICENWERTYKTEVMTALDACTAVECAEMQACTVTANQLCTEDVSGTIDQLCEKVSECGWEELTTMETCRSTLQANQGLYMCLDPGVRTGYVACVRAISCGDPDSEDQWYGCGAELQGA
jgi:hypothetical protein